MKVAVFGYGAVGRAIVAQLSARGDSVIVAQRSAPESLPEGVRFTATDILKPASVKLSAGGVEQIVCATGFKYRAGVWARAWPRAMRNILAAAKASGARVVLADNLYMYGPQDAPLREDMALTKKGGKPGVRAKVTRLWMTAQEEGVVKACAVRASDFYGPHVATSVLAEYGIKRMLAGKPALIPYSPDYPHDFTYVPDFARAVVSLLDAPDDCFGQAWHVPNAPTQTLRQLLEQAGALIGVAPKINVLPGAAKWALAPFMGDLRALIEMKFQTDRPYHVDHSKFAARFWSDATPFEVGLKATIAGYRR